MTGSFISDVLLIFLVCYAMLHILHEIGDAILRQHSISYHRECLFLLLQSGSETLEQEIRTALRTSDDLSCSLLIVDDGLNQSEKLMLWRLTDGCEHVTVTESSKFPNTMGQFSNLTLIP